MKNRNASGQFIRGGDGIWIDSHGYPCRVKRVHVEIWEQAHGPAPKGMHIHHKDLGKTNYALENLQLVTNSDHRRIHTGWVMDESGQWIAKPCKSCKQTLPLDQFYRRRKPPYTFISWCKDCSIKIAVKRQHSLGAEDAERERERARNWVKNNRQKINQTQRLWRRKKQMEATANAQNLL